MEPLIGIGVQYVVKTPAADGNPAEYELQYSEAWTDTDDNIYNAGELVPQKNGKYYDIKGNLINAQGERTKADGTVITEEIVLKSSIKVDVSNYANPSKEYTVEAYADIDIDNADTNKESLKINKQSKSIKAAYKPLNDVGKKIEVKVGETVLTDNTLFEYKPLYATEWKSGEELTEQQLDFYSLYGTTLLIREKAVTSGDADKQKMISKEAKLKIPKKANGPKITMDVSKLMVNLPANAQWRVVDRAGNIVTKTTTDSNGWVTKSGKQGLSLAAINKELDSVLATNLVEGGLFIEAKTPAKGKKSDSKISYFSIPEQPSAPAAGTDFTVDYKDAEEKKKITIKAETGDIQIVIDAVSDVSTARFTTIKKGNSKTYSTTVLSNDKVISVRFAGKPLSKSNTVLTLASEIAPYTVAIPKAPEALTIKLEAGFYKDETILTLAPAANMKYSYLIGTAEVKDLAADTKLPDGTTELTLEGGKEAIQGAAIGKYLTIYEHKADGTITKFASTKLTADETVENEPAAAEKITGSVVTASAAGKLISVTGVTTGTTYGYKMLDAEPTKVYVGERIEDLLDTITATATSLNENNIEGLVSGKVLVVYELDANGTVVKYVTGVIS